MNIIQKETVSWKENNECVEENTNSLYCSAEEEKSESGNDWLESSDSDSNSDSDFELHSE